MKLGLILVLDDKVKRRLETERFNRDSHQITEYEHECRHNAIMDHMKLMFEAIMGATEQELKVPGRIENILNQI